MCDRVILSQKMQFCKTTIKNARTSVRAFGFFVFLSSKLFGKFENQFFGILPAEAGIGDRFSVDSAVGGLRTFLDIRFDHKPLDDGFDVGGLAHAVQHFFCDTRLFKEFFCGIRVVCIHNNGVVFKSALGVQIGEFSQVLVVIVGDSLPVFVH